MLTLYINNTPNDVNKLLTFVWRLIEMEMLDHKLI